MKLIDKDKLLDRLEELRQNLSMSPIVVIEDIKSLVESLEVKEEIDTPINKEKIKEIDNRIERQYKNMMRKLKDANHKTKDFSMNN